jgi:uncharacterized protein YraI
MLKSSSLLLAAAVVLLASGAAFAAPAKANANANIRSGPGTSYGIVAALKKGEYIIVRSCSANWCKVTRPNMNGYVARTLLYNPYYGSKNYYQFSPKTPDPGRQTRR